MSWSGPDEQSDCGVHTQALRMRWSSNEAYASALKSFESSAGLPCSLAHFLILFVAIGAGASVGDEVLLGRRKGKAPEGEAWLLDTAVLKSTPHDKRWTCHFKHVGLNDGEPLCVPSGVVKR